MVTVSDEEIVGPVGFLAERAKQVVEPSGAAALADVIGSQTLVPTKKSSRCSRGEISIGLPRQRGIRELRPPSIFLDAVADGHVGTPPDRIKPPSVAHTKAYVRNQKHSWKDGRVLWNEK